ncbi:MAG: sugar ABC transporter permease YjfF [Oscillospiraceae bacterium]|jgi:simple sugar transport system permease protein|nr:sugar ABC transporter permease YjfF [Oscillospiraceae bacterium]
MTDTNLLLSITIGIFVLFYGFSMVKFGGGFLRPNQFFDIFNENGALIIIACGLSVVMVAGGIDISVGGVTSFVCMVSVVMLDDHGFSVAQTLLLALGIGLAFGAAQGFLVSYLEIQPFIVSLAGMFFARGATTMVEVNPRTVQHVSFKALRGVKLNLPFGYTANNGNFIAAKLELGVIIALAIVIVIFIILRWTKFGRSLYAVGGNSQSALMLGINVKRTRFCSYLLCGLLAGIAGFVYLLHTGSGSVTQFSGAEMKAIASSIIGGTLLTGGVGNIIGTLFGVLLLATINLIVIALKLKGPWWQGITVGFMLSLFIILQSVILSYRNRRRATI